MEQWKLLECYDEPLWVSNSGLVLNKNKEFICVREIHSRCNYFIINVKKKGKQSTAYVHRLVAMAFVENPLNKPFVNHIDGNKHNNNADNLEWVTASENSIHAWKHLRSHEHSVDWLKQRVIATNIKTGEKLEFKSMREGLRYVGKPEGISAVSACCSGKRNQAYGYRWEKK